MISVICSFPTVCVWYSETSNKPYCILKEFEINYTNLSKIETCQDHKTLKQTKENWKKLTCDSVTKSVK